MLLQFQLYIVGNHIYIYIVGNNIDILKKLCNYLVLCFQVLQIKCFAFNNCSAESKSDIKRFILHNSIYMKFKNSKWSYSNKNQNSNGGKKVNGRRSVGTFRSVQNTFLILIRVCSNPERWYYLWKGCTQYASKFGKLSSGNRTVRGQFSFQSQRKAMPTNAQTTAQLHLSHTLVV